jgi:DNA repair protein RadA/Sms
VTKSGEIAGPRVLEHLVDSVLYFEGDKQNHLRLLRSVKNRFGSTDDLAIFQMTTQGLKELSNPSELFLEQHREGSIGSVIIPTLEGVRPLLIEVQALVSHSIYPSPSRKSTGLDQNRLSLLVAVLEKRLGYPLYQRDLFVALTGGIKITEPAIDLGILVAIASSFVNKPIAPHLAIFGEVSLSGEVRHVIKSEARIKEAIHMGFKKVCLPKHSLKGLEGYAKEIELIGVEVVEEAIDACQSRG